MKMTQNRMPFLLHHCIKYDQQYKGMNISHDFCIFFRLIIVFVFDNDFIFNKTFSTATFCIYNYIVMPYLCITRDTSVESYDIGRGLPNDLGIFLYDQSIRYRYK